MHEPCSYIIISILVSPVVKKLFKAQFSWLVAHKTNYFLTLNLRRKEVLGY